MTSVQFTNYELKTEGYIQSICKTYTVIAAQYSYSNETTTTLSHYHYNDCFIYCY